MRDAAAEEPALDLVERRLVELGLLEVGRRIAGHERRRYCEPTATVAAVILSDRTIREQIDAGRIVIEPFDPAKVQPSSVDLTLDRHFRVFRNHTRALIDVKENLDDLTELVEIDPDDVVHPPPRRVRARLDRGAHRHPRRPRRPPRGQELARPPRAC